MFLNLSKFHGYIFNGLGEKLILKLPPEILCFSGRHGVSGSSVFRKAHTTLNVCGD